MSLRGAWRYAWASPATLLGLLLAGACLAGGGRARVVGGVLEVGGGSPWRALRRTRWPWRFDAITLGHVVLAESDATLQACRVHERVHVRQYERFGPTFFLIYAASSIREHLRGGDAYRDNRFEREAFAEERRHAAPRTPVRRGK